MSTLWVTPEELSNPSSQYASDAIASASYILWALSGRKFTFPRSVIETYECPLPVDSYGWNRAIGVAARPEIRNGSMYNICTRCGTSSSIRLKNNPALKIEYVIHQGETLSPEQYELVNRAVLRPTNRQYWNLCDGVKVRYRFGQPPPIAGRRAAKVLADQFLLSWSGQACKLPQRLTSITRQDVSMTVLDTQDFLDDGKTGLYEVDLFLRSTNPSKATRRARVFSPDQPRAARLADYELLPEATDVRIIPGEVFEQDFIDIPGPSLDGTAWKARGQLEFERGGSALVLGDSYWTVIPNGVRLTIPDTDTLFGSSTNGTFSIYAVRVDDESVSSLIYTSRLFVTAAEV